MKALSFYFFYLLLLALLSNMYCSSTWAKGDVPRNALAPGEKIGYNAGMKILLVYLVCINLVSFGLMAADKRRARARRWRIPERTLFAAALLGGSLGAIVGMYLFRHKTKHWYFVVGMPLILAAEILIGVWLAGGNYVAGIF